MRLRALGLLLCIGLFAVDTIAAAAADASRAQGGAGIYQLRCSGCHGENLRGLSGGWSFDLRRLRPGQHDEFVRSVISRRENMPSSYGVLKPEEIEATWAYIRATVDK